MTCSVATSTPSSPMWSGSITASSTTITPPKEFGYEHFVPGMVGRRSRADFVGLDCPLPDPAPREHLSRHPLPLPLGPAPPRRRPPPLAGQRHRATAGKRRPSRRGAGGGAPPRYGVTVVEPIEVRLPDELGLVTVFFTRNRGRDGGGAGAELRQRRRLHIASTSQRSGRRSRPPLRPRRLYRLQLARPAYWARGSKFGATGAGWVDYAIGLPDDLDLQHLKGIRLRFEAGARTAHARVDWRDTRHMQQETILRQRRVRCPQRLPCGSSRVRIGTAPPPRRPGRRPRRA